MNYFNAFIAWVNQLKIDIIDLLKSKQNQKSISINENYKSTSCEEINDSLNISASQTGIDNTMQVIADDSHVSNASYISTDIIKSIGLSYINSMFPHQQPELSERKQNALSFLETLNSHLEASQVSQDELNKFSNANVQAAFQDAIAGASKNSSKDVHEILSQLIADRIQKPKNTITELVINQAIEVTSKLDANLIKILALSFIFTKAKYPTLIEEEILIKKLIDIADMFEDVQTTESNLEYLESVSCGKEIAFTSKNLIQIITNLYPQLFLKTVKDEQFKMLSIDDITRSSCFLKTNDGYKITPHLALYLFKDAKIKVGNKPFAIEDQNDKNKIKKFIRQHQMPENDIRKLIISEAPAFEKILKLYDDGFKQFTLTSIGLVIGRAFLAKIRFSSIT